MTSGRLRRAVRLALLGLSVAGAAATAVAQEPPASATDAAGDETLGEVVVTSRQRTSAEEVLQERIEQAVVVDIVSAEQISRVGDSTVSLALRRLPGVTLVGDQFIYIRGLGERYSSTTLNGAFVPSPDLTRNVIPLDLFPAEIVESLSIQKVFSPDKPAAFGGGNVDVRTRTIPEDFTFVAQIGTGINADSDGDGITYTGGSDDEWGRDDGTRALPAEISAALVANQGRLNSTAILETLRKTGRSATIAEAEAINRGLGSTLYGDVDFRRESLDPDLSGSLAVGNSWDVGPGERWKVGFLALGDYENTWRNRERIERSALEPEVDYDVTQRTINQTTVTGTLALGLDYAQEQTIGVNVIYLRNTDDEASVTTGFNTNVRQESGEQLRSYGARYEQRELMVYQVDGRHVLGPETLELVPFLKPLSFAEGLAFAWYWSDATAETSLPNEVTFSARDRIDPVTAEVRSTAINASTTAADFRFSELEDDVNSSGWSLTYPLSFRDGASTVELSGGQDYYEKGRGYLQTRLGLGTSTRSPVLNGTPADVFTAANVLDPANGFVLSLNKSRLESYLAGEIVEAGFGKFDLKWNETWRVAGGARWESFERVSIPVDPLEYDVAVGKIGLPRDPATGRPLVEQAATVEDDWYPALSVTYVRPEFWAESFQLRFGWSQTVARPDLREVANATYIDPLTEARITGNPALVNADLSNFDVRGEWFFSGGDNFTVSLFYKDISDPIETVEGAGSDDNVSLTFVNAESAEVYGVEFEWLKGLGFLTDGGWSDAFFVSGNVTLSDSEIKIGPDTGANLTNDTRRLSQHAQYVGNLQLGWDSTGGMHSASLVYGVVGERIFFAGRGGAPDAYEQPFHSLDLVYSFYPMDRLSLKLRFQNLLDENVEIEQGGTIVLEQSIGRTAKLDLAYRF